MIQLKRKLGVVLLFGLSMTQLSSAAQEKLGQRDFSPLIVGGVKASPREFPFIVSLQKGSWGHFCAGSLISPSWVLTAAHCVKSNPTLSGVKIVTGLHKQSSTQGTEVFSAKKVLIHPEYQSKAENDFDFALIQLSGISKFTPILLNSIEIEIPEVEKESPFGLTTGWGTTQQGGSISDTLMKVSLPLVSAKRCESAYPNQITDRMICAGLEAGGKDSCQGDSGGPLLYQNHNGEKVLAGVVSWGEGCALPKKYGVYGKVNSVDLWIEKQINLK